MQFLNNYSNRELNIWAELILSILVSFYFFPKIFPLIINDQLYSEALVDIVITSIIIAIIYSIFVFGAINTLTKREEKDERDYIYELKSYRISNIIFHVSIYLLISLIVFNPISQVRLNEFTAPMIAMILPIITLLSSIGKCLTQLFNYRKNI
jgi:uncharacterized protein YacL|tara:strand:+ start:105 stop:563 length:459 start_codon:yes stop_codon:yes gene_type:complete